MSIIRRRLLDDTIKKKMSGKLFVVKSVARKISGLKIFGKSTQLTTTGAQLLNKSVSGVYRGVSWLFDNSKVVFKGTTNNDDNSRVFAKANILDEMEVGKTYYSKSFTDGIETDFRIIREGSNEEYSKSITLDGTEISVEFRVLVNGTAGALGVEVNCTAHVAVTEDDNMAQWEPYTGGKISPSPDYPQEIVNIGNDGEVRVKVEGAQRIDFNNYVSFSPSGTWTSILCNSFRLEPGQYYFSCTGSFSGVSYKLWVSDDEGLKINIDNNRTFEILQNDNISKVRIVIQSLEAGHKYEGHLYPMINKGSEPIPWEPYKQPQVFTLSTLSGLPGIPVSSGGNYTDENGQQWVCDEIDLKRGKYVQRVTKKVVNKFFDGTDYPNTNTIRISTGSERLSNINDCVMSTVASAVDSSSLKNTCRIYRGETIFLFVDKNEFPDLEAVNNFFKEKPVEFLVGLGTPVETDLTPEEIAAYQELHTYSPTTTIINSIGAGMELSYKTRKSLEVSQ